MFRLYKEELKKIFKNKLSVLLMISAVVYGVFMVYSSYHMSHTNGSTIPLTLMDGTKVSGYDYYQKADQILHQYQGIIDESLIQRFQNDYDDLYKNLDLSTYDDEEMIKRYGSDYLDLIEKAKNMELTEKDFLDFMDHREHRYSYSYQCYGNHPEYVESFEVFYKDTAKANFLSLVYFNALNITYLVQSEAPLPLGMALPEKENLIFDVNQANKIVNYTPSDTFQLSSKDIEFGKIAVNKYQQYASEFDSVIGNNFLLNAVESFNYVYLMIIAFILAPLFSLEKHHEMEGIQISSKKGRRTLVLSKFLAGFSISTGLYFVNLLNIMIQSFIHFPTRNLKLLVQSQAGLSVGEAGTGKYVASFLTYGEVLWQCLLGAFVAFLGIAFITMLISYLTKNQMITFGFLLLLILLCSFSRYFPNSIMSVLNYLPMSLLNRYSWFQVQMDATQVINTYFVLGNNIYSKIVIISLIWIGISMVGSVGIAFFQERRYRRF